MWYTRTSGSAVMIALFLIGTLAWAAPPEGKGKDNAPGQAKKAEQSSGGSTERGNSAEARATERGGGNADNVRADRTHPHADKAADRTADRDTGSAVRHDRAQSGRPDITGRDRRSAHAVGGREAARLHVANLTAHLWRLHGKENAKWWKHPTDTRGQGNMGKVLMRSPFGFDKDSGREGAERGRAIHEQEPLLDLASIVSVDFGTMDWWLEWYTAMIAYYQKLLEESPWSWWYADQVKHFTYFASLRQTQLSTWVTADEVEVYQSWLIDYTMALTAPEGAEGEVLNITTSLISASDYSQWIYDYATKTWSYVSYTTGQVVYSETDQVTLGTDSTYTFSYDPPTGMVGWGTGAYFQLSVTVSDADGQSYTIDYDRLLYLYRCPYGVVYDKATGKPIAGAVVTVHDAATGAIIALDKASNSTASNPQTTDATGRYDAKLQIGRQYFITVKAPGYDEYKSPVFSERWHVVREDIPLHKVQRVVQK